MVTHYLLTVPVILGGASLVGLLTSKTAKLLIPRDKDRAMLQMLVAVLSPALVFFLVFTARPR
jgi:O-antigen ligase